MNGYTKGERYIQQLNGHINICVDGIVVAESFSGVSAAHLISAASDMAEAGQGLDRAIGTAILEIAQTNGLDTKLLSTIQAYILPAQEKWRKAIAKAEGKG